MLNYGNKKSLGIDINNYNIEYLKSKGKNVLVIPKNGIFPLKEESFNVIICDQVLEHIEDPSTFLSEIYRCLKKDGKLIIGVPQIKGFKKDPDHKVFYNQDFLRCKLKRYNFTYKYHFYLPFPLKIFGNFLTQQYMYTIFRKVVKVKSNKINLIFSIVLYNTDINCILKALDSINSLKEDNKSNEFSINKVLIIKIQRKNIQKRV